MLKQYSFILYITVLFLSSCDDAGIAPDRNRIEFSHTGLKPLTSSQGVYELWFATGSLSDHDDASYKSAGRFNITPDGTVTPENAFNLGRIPDINLTDDAIITIEPPDDRPDTIDGVRLLGGAKVLSGNSLIFNLSMDYNEVLGSLPAQMRNSTAEYMLVSLSTNDTNYYRQGFWFTKDVSGTTQGLTLPVISDSVQWYYRMWLIDSRDSLNVIYYAGGFDNPFGEEDDYRFCYGSFQINIPGNDWIQTGGQCPQDLINLSSGYFRLLVTLEPRGWNWVNAKPFYLKLFYGSIPQSSYGTVHLLNNVTAQSLPNAVVRLYTQ
jgi:hypothetical protein